jgi:hypothetical protein
MCVSNYHVNIQVNKSVELKNAEFSWIKSSLIEFIELNFSVIDHNRRLFNRWEKRFTSDLEIIVIKLADFRKDKRIYFFLKTLCKTQLENLFRIVLQIIFKFDLSDRKIIFEQ